MENFGIQKRIKTDEFFHKLFKLFKNTMESDLYLQVQKLNILMVNSCKII